MMLFEVARQHRSWLAMRQAAVAENIANVNTPGYRARSVQGFEAVLMASVGDAVRTHAGHFEMASSARASPMAVETEPAPATHAGNSVDLEAELLAGSDVHRGYALNVAVVRSFNRMLMAVTRS